MTPKAQCIHGFPTEQCVSCRTCPHGQSTSMCVRCRSAVPVSRKAAPAVDRPSEAHHGYEVFYEPAVSGWRYRGPDSTASPLSYRSAFLARKAVDARVGGDEGEPAAKRSTAKRRKA